MRWEDERYVRLYTRDTPSWLMLPWQAKALLPLLLRKCDRAGVVDLGGEGMDGLAVLVGLPPEVLEIGIEALLRKGTVRMSGDLLVCPNYIEAQETAQSDAARQRTKREKDRDVAIAASRAVTAGHAASQPVTPNHAVPSEPAVPVAGASAPPPVEVPGDGMGLLEHAEDERHAAAAAGIDTVRERAREALTLAPTSPPKAKRKRDPDHVPDPRHALTRERLCAEYQRLRGRPYPFDGRAAKVLQNLLGLTPSAGDLVAAWTAALQHKGFPSVETLSELYQHLPRFLPARTAEAPTTPTSVRVGVWGAALATIEREGKTYALQWLERIRQVDVTTEVLTLEVPDKYFAAWVQDHYSALIERAAAPRRIAMRIAGSADATGPPAPGEEVPEEHPNHAEEHAA